MAWPLLNPHKVFKPVGSELSIKTPWGAVGGSPSRGRGSLAQTPKGTLLLVSSPCPAPPSLCPGQWPGAFGEPVPAA